MRTFPAVLSTATLLLAACGPSSPAEPTAAPEPASAPQAKGAFSTSPVPASATREDVAAALRCHAVLSSAMAARVILGGDTSALYGVREQTMWFHEADRRAKAAGITEAEFNAIAAESRTPMNTEAQRAANQPLLDECLANVPDA